MKGLKNRVLQLSWKQKTLRTQNSLIAQTSPDQFHQQCYDLIMGIYVCVEHIFKGNGNSFLRGVVIFLSILPCTIFLGSKQFWQLLRKQI